MNDFNITVKIPDDSQQQRIIEVARLVTSAFHKNPDVPYVTLQATDHDGNEQYIGYVPNPSWGQMLPEIQKALDCAVRFNTTPTVQIKGK